jgi:type IV fimbrial biogenesis protein FimT
VISKTCGDNGRLAVRQAACQLGFTLVELMITLAVAGVLVAIAMPAFNEMTLGSKLRNQANDLAAGALLARSEAIKRNQAVTLCASSNGTSCTGSWSNGWVIRTTGGTVLQAHAAAPSGYLVTSTLSSIVFQPSGVGATSATLTVCRATPSAGSQERVVDISVTGRAKVRKTETGTCS